MLLALFLVLFFLRAVWNILYWFSANPVQSWIARLWQRHQRSAFDTSFLVFYCTFEVLPTAFVVYIFLMHVPSPPTATAGGGAMAAPRSQDTSAGATSPAWDTLLSADHHTAAPTESTPLNPDGEKKGLADGMVDVALHDDEGDDVSRWNVDALKPLVES